MTRLEHAAEAERLLVELAEVEDDAEGDLTPFAAGYFQRLVQVAQVHATLATITADVTPRPVRSYQ